MICRLTCPVCDSVLPSEVDSTSPLFPFCSRRCKQVDLYRWLNGSYAIVEPLSPEELLAEEMLRDDESQGE